jgi:MFS family permease
MAERTTRQSPLLALLVARAISETGTLLSGVALPLFVWSLSGSTAEVGLVTAALTLPLLLIGLAGGPLVDRLGPGRISVLADCGALVAFGCVPLLAALGALPLAALVVLVFTGSCAEALGQTARSSLIPELAQEAGWSLERANATVSAIGRAAIVLGPLLAGLLVSVFGPAPVLLIDALTFGFSALIIGVGVGLQAGQARPGAYTEQLRDGVRFLSRNRQILTLMGLFSVFNLLINPVFMVVLPVYTSTMMQAPSALGILIASFGAGTLVGAALYGVAGARFDRRALLCCCFGAITLAFVPLVVQAPLPLLAAGCALMGLGVGPCSPLVMTALAERTPAELRGRVFGLYSAGAYGGIPPGVLVVGQTMVVAGVAGAVALLAGAFVLLTVTLLLLPRSLLPLSTPSGATT